MTLPPGSERDVEQACRLLQEYSFELGGYAPQDLVNFWYEHLEAEPSWIRSAVLEALYQGRYKAFSVEQILRMWKRRGHPTRHFNHDFERVAFGPTDPMVAYLSNAAAGDRSGEAETSGAIAAATTVPAVAPAAASATEVPPSDVPPAESRPNPLGIDQALDPTTETSPPPISPDPWRDDNPSPAAAQQADSPSALLSPYPPSPTGTTTASAAGDHGSGWSTPSFDRRDDPFSQPAPIQTFEPTVGGSSVFYHRLEAIARQFPS